MNQNLSTGKLMVLKCKIEPAYLTEQKLVNFLYEYVDHDGIHNKKFGVHRFRPDFVSHKHKLVVEFDGYLHYTKAKTVLSDMEKDKIFKEEDYSIVRIPYFVQLTKPIMKQIFGRYLTVEPFNLVDYPHGFIDTKAVVPADFCTLGVERFKSDLSIYSTISNDILYSLTSRNINKLEVLPINFNYM
jgi:very-short-patch-repair endonuclease